MNGLLGNQSNDELYKLLGLTPEKVKQEQQTQGLLSAGLALLAGSGPSSQPRSLGQLVGAAGAQGLQAMRGAGEDQITNAVRSLQIKDMASKRDQESARKAAMDRYLANLPESERAKFAAFPTQAAEAMFREPKESFRQLTSEEKATRGLAADKQFQISNTTGKVSELGGSLVTITGGQKGFDNELQLKSKFMTEPVYKAGEEMKSAYSQIKTSLAKESPAGDLAAATKFMKLLDPGSVVRESELYMAMSATGALDRLTNYYQMLTKGTKLTPDQRKDFGELSDQLYNAAAESYNKKHGEYSLLGAGFGLNTERALGKPLDVVKRKPSQTDTRIDLINEELKRRGL